jgi:hypothetical protein
MQKIALPRSRRIGRANTPLELSQHLSRAMGADALFTHYERVRGAQCSHYLLSTRPLPTGSTRLVQESYASVAGEIFFSPQVMDHESRHPPIPPGLQKGLSKGWEVGLITVSGHPVAVIRACWVGSSLPV